MDSGFQGYQAVPLPANPSPGQLWTDSNGIEFSWIPPGSFLMGSPEDETGRGPDEGPTREVRIIEGFWLGIHEVTQGTWERVMGDNPSTFDECGEGCPVETVSWNDVRLFISRLNGSTSLPGYRLPSEPEWEYAARAGRGAPRYSFLEAIAWYQGNASGTPHPVGLKDPNPWGIHDMLGNVWEWCADSYQAYPGGLADNSRGPEGGVKYVRRGGSWSSDSRFCRAACRSRHTPDSRFSSLGFRLVFSSSESPGEK